MIWTNGERQRWLSEETVGWKGILTTERHSAAGGIVAATYLRWGQGIVGGGMRIFGRYALVCIIEGAGRYSDALGAKRPVVRGDVILVFPELAHNYYAMGQGWIEFHVIFTGPVFDLLRSANLLVPQAPIFHVDNVEELLIRFEEILSDDSCGSLELVYRCAAYITELISRNAGEKETLDAGAPWLRQALRAINEQLVGPLDIGEVARSVNMSYEGFRKAFRKSMGITVGQYHSNRRIEAARSLLEHTEMTVKQIADNLGFVDEYHFSNRFRKVTGERPGRYRSSFRRG